MTGRGPGELAEAAVHEEAIRALVADDDLVSRTMVAALLLKWGYTVTQASDGDEVVKHLSSTSAQPALLLLDWEMPGITGPKLCARIRREYPDLPVYIILLTARSERRDIVAGLESGADDYITKPYDNDELRSRVGVGARVLNLELRLKKKVVEVERALAEVKTLSGLLPMCSRCKRVRDDEGYWQEVEGYLQTHTEASFSHGLCPTCVRELYPEHAERILEQNRDRDAKCAEER